jgi:hypothetical protein
LKFTGTVKNKAEGRGQRAEGKRRKKAFNGYENTVGACTPVVPLQMEQSVLLVILITSSAFCPLPSAFFGQPSAMME